RIFMNRVKELEDTVGGTGTLISTEKQKGWHLDDHWFWRMYHHSRLPVNALQQQVAVPAAGGTTRDVPHIPKWVAERMSKPVYVHPELWAYAQSIFGKKIGGKTGFALDMVAGANAIMKRLLVALSPFHFRALFASTLPAYRGGAAEAGIRGAFDMAAAHKKLIDPEWMRDAAGHGLTAIELPEDARSGLLTYLGGLHKQPGFGNQMIGAAIKGATTPFRMLDHLTWELGLRHFAVICYEQSTQALVRQGLGEDEAKRRAATMTNAILGTPDWQNLGRWMRDPKFQQIGRALLLSLNWTASTIQQFMLPFGRVGSGPPPPPGGTGGGAGAGGGQTREQWDEANKQAQRLAAAWWARYVAHTIIVTQAINRKTTERDFGEARYTWENPDNIRRFGESGNPADLLRVHMGINKDTNRTWSIQVVKQLPEALGNLSDPLKSLVQKANPALRIAGEQVLGYQVGGDRPFPVKPGPFGEPFGEGPRSRAEHLVERGQPFIARRSWEPEGPVPGLSPGLGAVNVAQGIYVGAAQHRIGDAIDQFARGGDADGLVTGINRIRLAMKDEKLNAWVKAPKGKQSTMPDAPAGKMQRWELFVKNEASRAKSDLRSFFWKQLAFKDIDAAKAHVPTMTRTAPAPYGGMLYIDRKSMEKYLYSLIPSGRLWKGPDDDTLLLHGRKVRKGDIREALSWFK
ncbi:MAG TPA: hypothetical protein VNE39_11795, partial [Planctomycetota bacterium]|nr:hypothetical protein [Planctomycetota bacterium]